MDSRGAYVVQAGTVEIRPAEVPAFGDDDVLVKMLYDFEETGRAYEDGVRDKESLVKAVVRVSS